MPKSKKVAAVAAAKLDANKLDATGSLEAFMEAAKQQITDSISSAITGFTDKFNKRLSAFEKQTNDNFIKFAASVDSIWSDIGYLKEQITHIGEIANGILNDACNVQAKLVNSLEQHTDTKAEWQTSITSLQHQIDINNMNNSALEDRLLVLQSKLEDDYHKLLHDKIAAANELENRFLDLQSKLEAHSSQISLGSTSIPKQFARTYGPHGAPSGNQFKIVCVDNPNKVQEDLFDTIKSANSCLTSAKFYGTSAYEVKSVLNTHAPYWNVLVDAEPSVVDVVTTKGFIMWGNHRLRCFKYHKMHQDRQHRETSHQDPASISKISIADDDVTNSVTLQEENLKRTPNGSGDPPGRYSNCSS